MQMQIYIICIKSQLKIIFSCYLVTFKSKHLNSNVYINMEILKENKFGRTQDRKE
jgi:hypothetical protein